MIMADFCLLAQNDATLEAFLEVRANGSTRELLDPEP